MKAQSIKIGHIYWIDYEPVKNGEFNNGEHLSVVLKINNDKRTFVVMPLTSSANGVGKNKLNLGKIEGLPPKDTYAVFNQVRVVSFERFTSITEKNRVKNVKIREELFLTLFSYVFCDMIFSLKNHNDKISALKKAYDTERFNKAKDLAYDIIKLRKTNENNEKISSKKMEIEKLLKDIPFEILKSDDKAFEIFEEMVLFTKK